MTAFNACTIASNNYLPYARVFARSFLKQNPGGRVWTLVVDEPSAAVDYGAEPFEVVFAKELSIPGFRNFAFRYSILELNTAVKPYLLQHLFEQRGCRSICYFDPDIMVTDELGPLYRTLETSDMVLTPHVLHGIEDDRSPNERDFLLSGIYNLGFLGIANNPRSLEFLAWWQRRLHRECVHRVEQGLFVDQKWMDFAPAFLDAVDILRDPGYNVAYWNLVHRTLTRSGDGYRVGGSPLRFFHFSGFQIDGIESISKYQDRFTLDDRPDVRPLFEAYRSALEREGAREQLALPYAYDTFDNGQPVPSAARRILQRLDPEGQIWSDPFDVEAPGSFYAWLTEPVRTSSGLRVPRLALVLWDERPDVQAAFPAPLGADDVAFAQWFVEEARRLPDIGEPYAMPAAASLGETGVRATRTPADVRRRRNSLSKLLARVTSTVPLLDHDFARWLNTRPDFGLRAGSRVSRLAMLIHGQRSDLQTAFPEPFGTSRSSFVRWFVTYGRLEYSLPSAVVGPALRSLPPKDRLYARLWWLRHGGRLRKVERIDETIGDDAPAVAREEAPAAGAATGEPEREGSRVTVVGWAASPTGVGEACRGNLAALEAAGQEYSLLSLNHPALDRDEPLLKTSAKLVDPRAPVLLLHVNADMMPVVRSQIPVVHQVGKYVVGYWFWELSHFPLSLAASFEGVDEIWAPTRFCQRAFSAVAPCEVRWVPPGVRPPKTGTVDRFDLGIPSDSFLFFFAFDALSVPERKNPAGLLRAFERVVEEMGPSRVHLLLKISHTEGDPELVKGLRALARDLPVTILSKAVQRSVLQGLFAASDAYVSLHRSEGLGLPLIEAMHLGKPVVCTDYGGSTDFADESTAWPVRFRLQSLERPQGPYPVGAVWAEPDVEHAAAQMLEVVRSRELRAAKTAAARERVEDLYGLRSAGERLRRELDRISEVVESRDRTGDARQMVS